MTTDLSATAAFVKQSRPISRAQVEVFASRSVAFFGLLYGAQTLPVMLEQAGMVHPVWFWAYNVAIFGGLLLAVGASIRRRFVKRVNAWIAFSFLAAMATWPLAYTDLTNTTHERPWLWFMCAVAIIAAAIAFPPLYAALYLVAAPTVYGIVRLTPSGGGAQWDLAALDTIYVILLGGAALTIINILRAAADSVDSAQAAALARYSLAVRQHATEVERVEVDAIVHDSVLTTLISAAKARSPEAMMLTATMARNAIGHLEAAARTTADDDSLVSLEEVAERIADAASSLSAPFTLRALDVGQGMVSAKVAEALYSSAVQAMVNSLQHAGPCDAAERWVRITGVDADGIDIEVGDNGAGFDVDAVPTERLGVRVSIVERVSNAGGSASISSSPGEGAIVNIRWPHSEPASDPRSHPHPDRDGGEVPL